MVQLFTLSKTGVTATSNNYNISGDLSIELKVTNLNEHLAKKLITVDYPCSRNSTRAPKKLSVDLKQQTHGITITGWLEDTPSGSNAVTKKQQLMAMASQNTPNSNVTLVMRGETIIVQIEDMTFDDNWETETTDDTTYQMDTDNVKTSVYGKIGFTIKLVRAKDRGT